MVLSSINFIIKTGASPDKAVNFRVPPAPVASLSQNPDPAATKAASRAAVKPPDTAVQSRKRHRSPGVATQIGPSLCASSNCPNASGMQ
ncbi:hypothetical protein OEG84_08345 [Hoeflea sp. G2-23]|uniref:Uncharacterized protein n=1 Tax=Hoeflea algicola TaxID=2983763 RepID=A0ABT3Z8X4_9HYPH|nr:hypothetical protein [Hoeflea algicola]MCY0147726.1 hypothetical protein [Hoeflea algicola]